MWDQDAYKARKAAAQAIRAKLAAPMIASAEAKRERRRKRNLQTLFSQNVSDYWAGRKSINEVRGELGLPKVEDGETRFRPSYAR